MVVLALLITSWLTLGALAAAHAVMYKRDSRSSALWVMLSFTLPLIGPWLYWVLGINRFERRAMRIFGARDIRYVVRTDMVPGSNEMETIRHLTAIQRTGDRITRLPLLTGNAIEPLHNGEQAYPSMLEAIESAKCSVTLASYIFDWDEVGREFCAALGAAARRQVAVHVLLDGVGAVHSWSKVGRRLLRSGAQLAPFFPLRFPLGRLRLNMRNHRKILITDGRTGFTGGMNISHRHLVAAQNNPNRVEDLHFRVTGPIVGEMQYVFAKDWFAAAGRVLEGNAYFPQSEAAGPALCRGIASGPDEDFEKIHWLLLAAFAAAKHSVRVATPYFIPTPALLKAMGLASMRGVRVTLLLPSFVDLPPLRWAADAYLWQLLEHGVGVFRQPPPFVHTKLLIVDERWVLFGSANLDPRSFRLNFELNIEAYDEVLARNLCEWFDGLVARSEEVTLEDVDGRSVPRRLRDGFAKLFSPYL